MRAEAQTSLTLAWDPNAETDLAGYVVHAGTAPGVYSLALNVGDVTSFAFQPVVPGQRYCFALSAYLAGPVHGPNSAEVCSFWGLRAGPDCAGQSVVDDQCVGQERGFGDGRVRCGRIDAVRDQMRQEAGKKRGG